MENQNVKNFTETIPIQSVQTNIKDQTESYANVAAKTTNNNTQNVIHNDFSELKQMMNYQY